MFERTILGLDVGSWAVKAAVLRAGLRSLEFERFEHAPLPLDAPTEEREAALFSFVRERQLPLEEVVAALSSENVTQRHLRFPFSDARRVRQAIPFELEEELPVPLSGLLLAHEQVLSSPDQTDVLAVVCPREVVAEHLNELRLAGVEPHVLEAEGAVLANLSSFIELAEAGRLLLDIGHSKTTLCLLVDGRPILLRSIALAGAQLTHAVSRDRGIAAGLAEESKHVEGLFEAGSSKPIGPSVGAVLERLSREVQRTIQSAVGDALGAIAPGQIVLTGGTAEAEHLDDYLEEQLGLPCRALGVRAGAEGMGALEEAGPARFAHAAALALRGAPAARVTRIDFRQGELAYKPDLSDLRRSIQLTGALTALALLLWMVSLGARLFTTERQITALETGLAGAYAQAFPEDAPPARPFDELQARVRETRALADHLGVTHSGLSALEVLRAVSAQLPPDLPVVITEFNLEPRTIQARGYAEDFETAGRMRTELQKLDWIQEVRLTDVVTDARRGGKSFNLTIRVKEGS